MSSYKWWVFWGLMTSSNIITSHLRIKNVLKLNCDTRNWNKSRSTSWGSLWERGGEILRGNSADGACGVASKPLIDANRVEHVITIRYQSHNLGLLVIAQANRTAALHVLRSLIWISRFQRLAGFLWVYDPGATWIQRRLIHLNYNANLRGGATSTASSALYCIS